MPTQALGNDQLGELSGKALQEVREGTRLRLPIDGTGTRSPDGALGDVCAIEPFPQKAPHPTPLVLSQGAPNPLLARHDRLPGQVSPAAWLATTPRGNLFHMF